MTRRAIAASLTLAVGIAFGLAPGRALAASVPVTIQYQSFHAGSIDALPGDAITWTNHGGRTHTVTADHGAFDFGDARRAQVHVDPDGTGHLHVSLRNSHRHDRRGLRSAGDARPASDGADGGRPDGSSAGPHGRPHRAGHNRARHRRRL